MLALSNLVIGGLIGLVLGLPVSDGESLSLSFVVYGLTTMLAIPLGTCAAFLALAGKGYLSPLAFVCLTIVVGQIIAALGFANYFPWAIPGLFSMTGGEYRDQLRAWSYLLVFITGGTGYVASVLWWRVTDQP